MFGIALVACATLILLAAEFAPVQIRRGGLMGTLATLLAPGVLLYGTLTIVFPSLASDPTEDLSDITPEELRKRGLEVLLPLICLTAGGLVSYLLLQ